MPTNYLKRAAVLVCTVVTLSTLSALAEEKKEDKRRLSGVREKQGVELRIGFSDKDVMRISPHGDNEVLIIVCKYALAKDGLVKAKVTDLEGKDEVKEKAKDKVPTGLEFTF